MTEVFVVEKSEPGSAFASVSSLRMIIDGTVVSSLFKSSTLCLLVKSCTLFFESCTLRSLLKSCTLTLTRSGDAVLDIWEVGAGGGFASGAVFVDVRSKSLFMHGRR